MIGAHAAFGGRRRRPRHFARWAFILVSAIEILVLGLDYLHDPGHSAAVSLSRCTLQSWEAGR